MNMPASKSALKKRHAQFFRDDEDERVLAHVESDHGWISGFLVRIANVVHNMAHENKPGSRPENGAF
jgi:hypothetical protein